MLTNELDAQTEQSSGPLLTPEGYARLRKELDELTTVKRQEIADRIRESQSHGEFSEDNQELDEVKFEQAMVESRISELKALFGSAQIMDEAQIPTDYIGFGSVATLYDVQYDDQFDVRIVSSAEADPSRDLVSNESPMGLAVFGASEGDTVSFESPDGVKRMKVVKIRR